MAPAPWLDVQVPAVIRESISMLSPEEEQYLIWVATERFENWGAIVELGTWLGTSTMCLAEGLRRRGLRTKIRSFDLFVWDQGMADRGVLPLKPGDDFLPDFLHQTSPYADLICAERQDLMHYRWTGGPIELLFIDSAKSWSLINAVLKGFGDSLVPGRSLVVFQDFRFPGAICLPLIVDSRPDIWEETDSVGEGQTAAFRILKSLFGDAGIHHYSEESFPISSVEALLNKRIVRGTSKHRVLHAAALFGVYLKEGALEQAERLRELVRTSVDSGLISAAEVIGFDDPNVILNPIGWKAYREGDFARSGEMAERILSLTSDPSQHTYLLLGLSRLRLHDVETAKSALDRSIALDPNFAEAQLGLAEIAMREGRFGEAESAVASVLARSDVQPAIQAWALDLQNISRTSRNGPAR